MSKEFRKEIQTEIDCARNDLREVCQGLEKRIVALEKLHPEWDENEEEAKSDGD